MEFRKTKILVNLVGLRVVGLRVVGATRILPNSSKIFRRIYEVEGKTTKSKEKLRSRRKNYEVVGKTTKSKEIAK